MDKIKPATLLRHEFIEKQAELINYSGLPAFVLVDILEKLLTSLRELEEKQYKADKEAWEKAERGAERDADT